MNPMTDLQLAVAVRIRKFLGDGPATDRAERARRLLEEALELAQAEDVDQAMAERILARVYSRPKGDPEIEGGDVGITWIAWCSSFGSAFEGLVERRLETTASMRARIRASACQKHLEGIGLPPDEEIR